MDSTIISCIQADFEAAKQVAISMFWCESVAIPNSLNISRADLDQNPAIALDSWMVECLNPQGPFGKYVVIKNLIQPMKSPPFSWRTNRWRYAYHQSGMFRVCICGWRFAIHNTAIWHAPFSDRQRGYRIGTYLFNLGKA